MCKGFVLPSNCIDDRGLPAFCVFHGTKSVNNGVMCKGFWLPPSRCIDDLGCTAFCVFHGRARRATRSSNTKACIPAGKHLQVIPLCCHEAVWLCSLCVAACRCTRCRWGTNRLRECPRRSCQGLCATSRRDGARAGGSARNKCKHVCRCAADTECLHGLMAPNPCLSDCRPPLVRRPVPSTKAKRIGKVGVQALNFLGCSRF